MGIWCLVMLLIIMLTPVIITLKTCLTQFFIFLLPLFPTELPLTEFEIALCQCISLLVSLYARGMGFICPQTTHSWFKTVVLNWQWFWHTLAMSGDNVMTGERGWVLLASSGWRMRLLLNILKCVRQYPEWTGIQPWMSIVPLLRKPALEKMLKIIAYITRTI